MLPLNDATPPSAVGKAEESLFREGKLNEVVAPARVQINSSKIFPVTFGRRLMFSMRTAVFVRAQSLAWEKPGV